MLRDGAAQVAVLCSSTYQCAHTVLGICNHHDYDSEAVIMMVIAVCMQVSELAAILGSPVRDVAGALGVACRLGFATRITPGGAGGGVSGGASGGESRLFTCVQLFSFKSLCLFPSSRLCASFTWRCTIQIAVRSHLLCGFPGNSIIRYRPHSLSLITHSLLPAPAPTFWAPQRPCQSS